MLVGIFGLWVCGCGWEWEVGSGKWEGGVTGERGTLGYGIFRSGKLEE